MIKRFWISWHQLTKDFRPLQDPPQPDSIKAWWCSGEAIAGHDYTLCAIVDAETEAEAKTDILTGWQQNLGEVGHFRFCEERESDWLPNDRFPVTKDWEKQRLGIL